MSISDKSKEQVALEGFLQTQGGITEEEQQKAMTGWDLDKLHELATNFGKDFPLPCQFWAKPKTWYGLSRSFDLGKCLQSFIPQECRITIKVNNDRWTCGSADGNRMATDALYFIRKVRCLSFPYVNFDLGKCWNFLTEQAGVLGGFIRVIDLIGGVLKCLLKNAYKLAKDALSSPIQFAKDYIKKLTNLLPAILQGGASGAGKAFKVIEKIMTGGRIDAGAVLKDFVEEIKKLGNQEPIIKCLEPIIDLGLSMIPKGSSVPATLTSSIALAQVATRQSEENWLVDWIANTFWRKNVKPSIDAIFKDAFNNAATLFKQVLGGGASQGNGFMLLQARLNGKSQARLEQHAKLRDETGQMAEIFAPVKDAVMMVWNKILDKKKMATSLKEFMDASGAQKCEKLRTIRGIFMGEINFSEVAAAGLIELKTALMPVLDDLIKMATGKFFDWALGTVVTILEEVVSAIAEEILAEPYPASMYASEAVGSAICEIVKDVYILFKQNARELFVHVSSWIANSLIDFIFNIGTSSVEASQSFINEHVAPFLNGVMETVTLWIGDLKELVGMIPPWVTKAIKDAAMWVWEIVAGSASNEINEGLNYAKKVWRIIEDAAAFLEDGSCPTDAATLSLIQERQREGCKCP